MIYFHTTANTTQKEKEGKLIMKETGQQFSSHRRLRWWDGRAFFVPRKIYVFSEDKIAQHIEVSTQLQACLLGLVITFLSWTTYSFFILPINKNALEKKEAQMLRMQSHYEERIAGLQHDQETTNARIALLQSQFLRITRDLEERHEDLFDFIGHREKVRQQIDSLQEDPYTQNEGEAEDPEKISINIISPLKRNYALRQNRSRPSWHTTSWGRSQITDPLSPKNAFDKFRYLLAKTGHPDLDAIPERLQRIDRLQNTVLSHIEEETARDFTKLDRIIRATRLSQREIAHLHTTTRKNIGGPFLPPSQEKTTSPSRQRFLQMRQHLENTERLSHIVSFFPVHPPLKGRYVITSRFGMRIDPINGKPAMHYGVDLGGHPVGGFVRAALPGTITIARHVSAFGQLVEIDHGGGIKTRYGHLSQILVERGETVGLNQPIGRLGSTGRSTGPHLHYEIWVKGKARDPVPFLEAGRKYVLNTR